MTLHDKMLAVMAEVNRDVAERSELVEMIAIAKTCLSWARPVKPRATPSTASAPGSPAPGSLSACSPSKRTKNSFSGAWTCPL